MFWHVSMTAGAPTKYNSALAKEICEWLAGGQSLRAYCRQPGTPDVSTITRWIVKHEKFRIQYALAREAAGYAHADEVKEVTEAMRDGLIDAQVGKAIMDGLKWSAERMAPRAHSAKHVFDHLSSDGSMTPKVVERVVVRPGEEVKDSDG